MTVEYALAVAAVVILPFAIGWLRGRHQTDPNTVEGKAYYNSNKGE